MIAKFMILCLAVSALNAVEDEVHYHYHMDGENAPAKNSHKGLKLCLAWVNTKYGGCISVGFWSPAKRQACKDARDKSETECNVKYPVVVAPKRLLSTPKSHKGWCSIKLYWKKYFCNRKANKAETEALKQAELKKCTDEYTFNLAACDAKRSLSQLSKNMTSKHDRALFCSARAKNAWFWCDLHAKIKGGDDKAANIKACADTYNVAQQKCNEDAKDTVQPVQPVSHRA